MSFGPWRRLELQDPSSSTLSDMAHADRDENLLLMRNQGLLNTKQQPSYFQGITLDVWAWLWLPVLSCFVILSMRCSQILMTGRLPLGEAIADHLVSIIVRPLVVLWAKGTKGWKLKSACLPGRQAILFLIWFLGLQFTAACANQRQNDADSQSRTYGVPNVRKTRDNELKARETLCNLAVAGTILATIGVAAAGRMYYLRSLVPTTPAPVPILQAIPAAVQALPVIPVVEGDDLDDVLTRAPIPTIPTSPLSWL